MEILGSSSEDFIILMMNFMHFVQTFDLMEESMPPVEEEIIDEIDEEDMLEDLPEGRNLIEPLLYTNDR